MEDRGEHAISNHIMRVIVETKKSGSSPALVDYTPRMAKTMRTDTKEFIKEVDEKAEALKEKKKPKMAPAPKKEEEPAPKKEELTVEVKLINPSKKHDVTYAPLIEHLWESGLGIKEDKKGVMFRKVEDFDKFMEEKRKTFFDVPSDVWSYVTNYMKKYLKEDSDGKYYIKKHVIQRLMDNLKDADKKQYKLSSQKEEEPAPKKEDKEEERKSNQRAILEKVKELAMKMAEKSKSQGVKGDRPYKGRANDIKKVKQLYEEWLEAGGRERFRFDSALEPYTMVGARMGARRFEYAE
jgi:hypothetical protein